jgi:hypothetical protein
MKPLFQHKLVTSTMLWFDNFFLKKAEAFTNQTGTFSYYYDETLPDGFSAFGTPYKQLVYDSSINGAAITNGAYVNGFFKNFNNTDFILDNNNARIIASGIPTGANITGSFSVKDINLYFSNDTEENIIINASEKLHQDLVHPYNHYQPYEQKIPAIYLTNNSFTNTAFALGGMNESITKVTAVAMTLEAFQLDAFLSVFGDAFNENISLCDFDSEPLNEFGSLKTGYYSYNDIKSKYNQDHLFVKYVNPAKMSDKIRQNTLREMYVGFVDLDLSIYRYRE